LDDCVFCLIASGVVPAKVVYEDDDVIAFDDISPQAPVHTLLIPRDHYASMNADVDEAVLCALFAAVTKVAEAKGVRDSGYRVIVNNGADANQTVEHLHVHVLGGRSMSHGMVSFTEA
jgi:histidine triad (HIT) family protein